MAVGVLWHRSHGDGGDHNGSGNHRLGTSGSDQRRQGPVRLDWRRAIYRSLDCVPKWVDLGNNCWIRSPACRGCACRVGRATGCVRSSRVAQRFPNDGYPAVQAPPVCARSSCQLPEFPGNAVGAVSDAVLPAGRSGAFSGESGYLSSCPERWG